MNMKKIMAGVAASALAVSMMTVAASAAEYEDTYTVSVTADKINTADEGFFTAIQVGHVSEIVVDVTYTDADGNTGNALLSGNWGNDDPVEAVGVTLSGSWNGWGIILPEDVATDDLSAITISVTATATNLDADVQAQVDAYGEEAIADIQIFILGINTAYANGFGKVVIKEVESAAPAEPSEPAPGEGENPPAPAEGENPPAPGGTDGAGTDPNKDKPAVDTGIEGVAIVAGLAIIAAGAVVVAKKRG